MQGDVYFRICNYYQSYYIFMTKVIDSKISRQEAYLTPMIRVVDIEVEGVLCSSGVDINDWERDEDVLDFN